MFNCALSKIVNLSSRGMEVCAPTLVTEIAAAAAAKIKDFLRSIFSDRATAKAPLNTSPAAVVSTALTLKLGILIIPSLFIEHCTLVSKFYYDISYTQI